MPSGGFFMSLLFRNFISLLLFAVAAHSKDRIGIIDFFGYKGFDVAQVRAAIPYKVGDPFVVSPANLAALQEFDQRVRDAVQQTTHRPPTDVAKICCDPQGDWEIYIGIAGKSSRGIPENREPKGTVRLPADAVELHQRYIAESMRVVRNGPAPDDHSQGYALSPDPELRAIELSMREYTLAHEEILRQVLASSSDANHRAVAAVFTGYARKSPQQIAALMAAVRDPNEAVRNNASRALGVLVLADGTAPPTALFVRMLSSGTWTDRNKALMVLTPLVARSDSGIAIGYSTPRSRRTDGNVAVAMSRPRRRRA